MSGKTRPNINPSMLRWARETSGYSIPDAVERGHVTPLKDKPAEERLSDWEDPEADEKPTWGQLKALAHAYHRPVTIFFMKAPPRKSEKLHDFRTLGDWHPEHSSELDALVRRVRAKQQQVRELLEADAAQPLTFLGYYSADDPVPDVVNNIREVLNFSVADQRRLGGRDRLFDRLRSCIEQVGIFVMVVGDLGSYHTRMEPDLFRGIALPDAVAPFIVINSYDAKAAQSFTLLHELAHLWIGAGGISNYSPLQERQLPAHHAVEQFCNRVAEELLAPKEEFLGAWEPLSDLAPEDAARRLADEFGVSEAAAAYRLWRFEKIDNETWWGLYRMYQARWERQRQRQRETEGGPSHYVVTKHHLGTRFISTVLSALDEGELSHIRAARMLGVRAPGFEKLREKVS